MLYASSRRHVISVAQTLPREDVKKLSIRRVFESDEVPEIRKARLEARKAVLVKNENKWRAAIDLLKTHTPLSDPHEANPYHLVLMIPEERIGELESLSCQIRDVSLRFHCKTVLCEQEYSTSGRRPLAMYGHDESIRLVYDIIVDALGRRSGHTCDGVQVLAKHSVPSSIRSRIGEAPSLKWRCRSPPATEVRPPDVWTYGTLAIYLHDLCRSSPVLERPSSPWLDPPTEGRNNVICVEDAVIKALCSPASRRAVTTAALNEALLLLGRRGMLQRSFAVLKDLRKREFHVRTSSFNVLLHAIALPHRSRMFLDVLREMISHGAEPNHQTWTALLRCIEFSSLWRVEILSCMRERGMFQNDFVMQEAMTPMLYTLAGEGLDKGWPIEKFIETMDTELGPRWLSTAGASQILKRLGDRRLFVQCLDLWETGFGRGLLMDVVSMNTIIHRLALASRSVPLDVFFTYVVRMLRTASTGKIVPNVITYTTLLGRALPARLHNVSRVVWMYACMYGKVGYVMRSWVLKSLWGNAREQELVLARELWLSTAGKVMVGIQYPEAYPRPPFSPGEASLRPLGRPSRADGASASDDVVDIMAGLCAWKTAGEARHQSLAIAKAMWRRDLESSRWIKPVEPLWQMLERAFALDMEWQRLERERASQPDLSSSSSSSSSPATSSGAWKVRHAIDVPTRTCVLPQNSTVRKYSYLDRRARLIQEPTRLSTRNK
ncbi:MAG: hypothetical protein M1815_002934 [Lichina confinis]|nr:MAG: hypothetical protein M1815_002934 [Lichina confinis]